MSASNIEAELVQRLRDELAARSLAEAAECPSWRVYADWLVERGDPLGEWLALALEPHDELELARAEDAYLRAHDGMLGRWKSGSLRALRSDARAWTRWFGPFALAVVAPGRVAQTLASTLGRHGALLLERRRWVDEDLAAIPLDRATSPLLVPIEEPALLEPIAAALVERARTRPRQEAPLLARPGEAMPVVLPPIPPVNPGPVYDPEGMRRAVDEMMAAAMQRMLAASTGILCCADAEDIRRHADDPRVRQLGTCVILGPRALLERWP